MSFGSWRCLRWRRAIFGKPEKKNPLILPPDYKDLPLPEDKSSVSEEISVFEKTLGMSIEEESSSSGSVEDSILEKIRSK